jgi:2-polyprenyl-3-methyl-5-hydroxy-6-metoxy-1,4-benzoquinol methylase
MSCSESKPVSQELFKTVYRGRQSLLHHMAYMRMAKVLLIQHILSKARINLSEASIFDYGFGAGTFFRYCPTDARISGVEIDPQIVEDVREMLSERGHQNLRLQSIDIAQWEEHPLLKEKFDILLCSHVLEHLVQPASFLRRMKACLNKQGVFVGLVPINERKASPQHVQVVDEKKIHSWAEESGLQVQFYMESDPWIFWLQPLFTDNEGWRHKLAQAASLAIGFPATLLGPRLWHSLSRVFQWVSFSKPTQATFVLSHH